MTLLSKQPLKKLWKKIKTVKTQFQGLLYVLSLILTNYFIGAKNQATSKFNN